MPSLVLVCGEEMRVFVVGTGRCGTSTFYQACRHITNYTSGHESAAGAFDLDYSDQHIEVAAPLYPHIGYLIEKYPDSKWIHLIRGRESCVLSLALQTEALNHWAKHWRQTSVSDYLKVAGIYYDHVNAGIRQFLRNQSQMIVRLEAAVDKWEQFWKFIAAEGDFEKSKAEWNRKYNPTGNRGRDNYYE